MIHRMSLPDEVQIEAVSAGAEEVRRVVAEAEAKEESDEAKVYEKATKGLLAWRKKYAKLGDDELCVIYREVFGIE